MPDPFKESPATISLPPGTGVHHSSPTQATGRGSFRSRTLLGKIIVWMFGPLFLLWTVGIVITYFIAQNIANAPYDRALTDHLRLLHHEVASQNISRDIQLSPTALSVLQDDNDQPIRWQIRDADGLPVGGNANIPLPDNWSYDLGHIKFHNEAIDGNSVRVAYNWGGQDLNGTPFLAVVAESNERRGMLQQEILTGMLTPQLIVLPLAALLAGLGLTQGLEPLNLLQERIRARRPNDLSPINEDLAPEEITPLVAAMNDLLKQLAASTETQRRFVANAAHQLKTPLAGIRTQAELALREHDPEKMHASLGQLIKGSQRATRLVNQLLALTRAESAGNKALPLVDHIDLNILAEQQTREWVQTAIQKGIDLGFESSLRPIPILGHGLMLSELFNNLIENALLYTSAGGWVTVRTGSEGDAAFLEVEDSGQGIKPEYRDRVFDRFFRVWGNMAEGSGLGLAIVKEITDQHHGEIHFMPPGSRAGQPASTCLRVSFSRFYPTHPGLSGPLA